MANDPNDALYQIHRLWIEAILPEGGSIITPGAAIWTDAALDELDKHFVGQPDSTAKKKFLEKLQGQLVGASPAAVQLMAELHIVHFLHIWEGAIAATTKRRDVDAILSWMPSPPTLPDNVLATFSPGIANPGQWVMTRRDTQLTWLIRFARAWRRLEEVETLQLLEDPWAFKAFVMGIEASSADGARLAMLHMTHPSTFAPIVSVAHKELIVRRFAAYADGSDDIDRKIAAIRKAVTPEYGDDFDWYDEQIRLRWWKIPAWLPFLQWIKLARNIPRFDKEERDYKLHVAALLREARELLLVQDERWRDKLRTAFMDKSNNLMRWDLRNRVLDWVTSSPDEARAAFAILWQAESKPWDRLSAFVVAVPKDVLGDRGQQLNLSSLLLMAEDPATRPPVKVTVLQSAFRLIEWPRDDNKVQAADLYRRALLLFEEVLHDSGKDTALRDLLDVQSALWYLLKEKQCPQGFPEAEWEKFIKFRQGGLSDDVITDDDGDVVDPLIVEKPPGPPVDYIARAAKDLHVAREHLDEIVYLLEDKGQVVLYGPPGTGKTYLALRLARAIAEEDETRVRVVQFHPATTYEDFIEGLRPRVTEAKQVTYEVVPGPLVRVAEQAHADPTRRYVLIVDEINRANLPKVFGELLFLLEYRKKRVYTIHRPEIAFGLPENLFVVGTMNTADRSIALIDAAMRRRFHFVPFFPHDGAIKGLLRRWLEHEGGRVGVAQFLDGVNAELEKEVGEHLLIGPSHFMRTDLSDVALERIWNYNVFPLIEEMHWGNRDRIDAWRWSAVRKRFSPHLGATAPSGAPLDETGGDQPQTPLAPS